jgi:AcrR family transcriptional regulator
VSQPPSRSTAVRPTDEQLLDGALEAAAEFGCGAVTMDQLAAAADSTKQTLYAHFGSKDALISRLHERENNELRTHLWAAYATINVNDLYAGLITQVTACVAPLYRYAAARPQGIQVLLDPTAPGAGKQTAALFRDVLAEAMSKGSATFEQSGIDTGVAESILAMVAASAIAGNTTIFAHHVDPEVGIRTTSAFIAGGIQATLAPHTAQPAS